MAEKTKKPSLITPAGRLKYPRIAGDADFRYKKDTGEFHTKILFEPAAPGVAEFLKKLDKAVEDAVEAMKEEKPQFKKSMVPVPAYVNEVDKQGEETGLIEFKASQPHKVTAKQGKNKGKTFEFRPALFDAKGNQVSKDARIGGGTVAKISFEFSPYFNATDKKAGITRRLIAVQIIKLVEWSNERDASDYGFGEEDGYSSLEEAAAPVASSDAGGDDDDTDTDTGNAGDF